MTDSETPPLQALVQQGWADHADKTAEVADRLEGALDLVGDPGSAGGFMNLVNHTIGDHLGDRARALRVNEAAFARLEGPDADEASLSGPLLYLTVARELGNDDAGAKAGRERLGDAETTAVRVDMLVAQGRMHAGDWDAARALYMETLAAANALPDGHGAERSVAIVSNNVASEILELKERTLEQANLMKRAAHAARKYWMRIGTWVNDERADYLLALVHNALGRPDDALRHADRALATIAANGEQKVDEAFLQLTRAGAFRDKQDIAAHDQALAAADALAADFPSDGLKQWFAEERAKNV